MAVQGKTANLMFWDVDDKKSYSPYTVFEFSSRDGEIYIDRTGFVSPTASAGFYSTSPTSTGNYSRADCNGNRACEQVPVPILPSGWQYGQGESVQFQRQRDPEQIIVGALEVAGAMQIAFASGYGAGMACGTGVLCWAGLGIVTVGALTAIPTGVDGLNRIFYDSIIDTTVLVR